MQEAQSIYEQFHDDSSGRDAIAGSVTIDLIKNICLTHRPARVLELGGGRGTLSYTALKHSDAVIDIYENLPQFQEEIRKHLAGMEDRFEILPSYYLLPPKRSYDLVIIDGGKNEQEGSFRKAIAAYLTSLDFVTTIVIEGRRNSQRYWVVEALWPRYLYRAEKFYDKQNPKKGALRIDCVPSSSFIKKFVNHLQKRKTIY